MIALPQPEVRSCYFDIGFIPPLAAMELVWPAGIALETRPWLLPSGERLLACLPRRFGVRIFRQCSDAYAVTVVWDTTYRQWFSLRRGQVCDSSLTPLLASMGTKLEYLLDQPLEAVSRVA